MEEQLLYKLYRAYYNELFLYLYSLCHNRELSEDMAQEAFLKALLSLSDNHANMRAWLYMVGRNLLFNALARQKRTELKANSEEFESAKQESILDELILDENRRLLYEAINHLDKTKREILCMQYFSGLSQKEIAGILGMSPENVRVLAFRGKKFIKEYMEDEGI
ncbi:RNA polymerase sigma factor [Butyrivibrio sp. INlla16]|uniref:RNA polymerase sigma factor n=1 Tax=Butyrivibrio sp. INlla16 TaxID=1520807 RepID=UPI000884F7F8|nr:RNA polymerase sigma factor [Butyrivibrio sp. INlla16]SDB68647.1 RNA polymerase sigma-70 factor, ECF subfamily [Butyrivibrio sp. INlla16]